MRLLGISLSLSVFLINPVLAAGNFEFAVPTEPGLKMNIVGYAADGTELFQSDAGAPELRDGKLFHTFRIDDGLLKGAPLAKWCVEEPTGKWSALAGGSATSLCDAAPSETRGRYVFTPSDAPATAAVTSAAPAPGAMTVAGATSCVQAGLNSIGYLAGAVDGAMGGRTDTAATMFADNQQGDAWPALSADTALDWCARLTSALADGSARGPMDDVALFRFGPDIGRAVAEDTEKGIVDINAYFGETFGEALKTPGTIYVSSDALWMTDAYLRQLNAGESLRRGKMENFQGCHGGEAGYGFLFMCANSEVFSGDWFNAGRAAQQTFGLAHEYFHMLQFERAYGDRTECCESRERLGPQWLVEGAAEYVAFRILGDSKRLDLAREIAWHTQKAAEVGLRLDEMLTRDGYYSDPLASSAGLIAAHMLAEAAGLSALGQFYTEMGTNKPWPEAFEAAFGETPEAFQERYEAEIH